MSDIGLIKTNPVLDSVFFKDLIAVIDQFCGLLAELDEGIPCPSIRIPLHFLKGDDGACRSLALRGGFRDQAGFDKRLDFDGNQGRGGIERKAIKLIVVGSRLSLDVSKFTGLGTDILDRVEVLGIFGEVARS